MRHDRLHFVLCLLSLVACVGAQTETVELRNGTAFTGRVVMETSEYVELEVGSGRVRLQKDWIDVRTQIAKEKTPDEPKGPGSKGPRNRNGNNAPTVPDAAPDRRDELMLAGALTLGSLQRLLPKTTEREREVGQTVSAYLDHLVGAEKLTPLSHLVDAMEVLGRAFPVESRRLTGYSRNRAARGFLLLLEARVEKPHLRKVYADVGRTMKTLRSQPDLELVEVSFNRGQAQLDERCLIGVSGSLIVDLTLGPMPVPQLLEDIRKTCDALGGADGLIRAIEQRAMEELGREAVLDALQLSPTSRRYRHSRFGNTRFLFDLPADEWKTDTVAADSAGLDIALRSTRDHRCVLVRSERAAASVAEIMQACILNLKERTSNQATFSEPKKLEIQGLPAMTVEVELSLFNIPVTFAILVFSAHGRAYQVATWAPKDDVKASRVQAVIRRFRLREF